MSPYEEGEKNHASIMIDFYSYGQLEGIWTNGTDSMGSGVHFIELCYFNSFILPRLSN